MKEIRLRVVKAKYETTVCVSKMRPDTKGLSFHVCVFVEADQTYRAASPRFDYNYRRTKSVFRVRLPQATIFVRKICGTHFSFLKCVIFFKELLLGYFYFKDRKVRVACVDRCILTFDEIKHLRKQ